MSIQNEFDVQRVVAAVKSEITNAVAKAPDSLNQQLLDQHVMELAEYTVQLARVQHDLDAAIIERDAAKAELAANIAYQQEALTRAAAAIESGDQTQLQAVLQFAGASFAEKERLKKLEKAAQLKAEATALEAEAAQL